MSVRIERVGDEVVLTAPLVSTERVKQIPGARFVAKTRSWRLPLSWATCTVARGVFGDDLEVGPELVAWAVEEKRTRIDPAMAVREAAE